MVGGLTYACCTGWSKEVVMTDSSRRCGRVPPALAWKHPGLPTEWTRVLERNPDAILHPEPLPGYVWLDTPGKVLHVEAAHLEFREDAPD